MKSKSSIEKIRIPLKSISRALVREGNVLIQYPDLLWQQLYNRLQWEEELREVLDLEFNKRYTAENSSWFQLKTPLRESATLINSLEGHTSHINSFCFSPKGNSIASASEDGTLKIWDFNSGMLIRTIILSAIVEDCCFTPDSKFILSANADMTLHLWEVTTGIRVQTFSGHGDRVRACDITPDGTLVCSASGGDVWSKDNTLRIWKVQTGEMLRTLNGHTEAIIDCSFSPDCNLIVSASLDNTLRVWETTTGRIHHILEGHEDRVNGCGFSPDGKSIISAGQDHCLKIWEVSSGCLLSTIKHTAPIFSCAFSPDSQYIISAVHPDHLILWSYPDQQYLGTYEGHTGRIIKCDFSPDGRFIGSAGWDRSIKIWESSSSQVQSTPEKLWRQRNKRTCSFSPNGKFIITGNHDNSLTIWDAITERANLVVEGHTDNINAHAMTVDGFVLVSASDDSSLKTWETINGFPLHTFSGHSYKVNSCGLSPDGKLIVSTGGHTLCVWESSSGRLVQTLNHANAVSSGMFSPDGTKIIFACSTIMLDPAIGVLNPITGKIEQLIKGHKDTINDIVFSPEGDRMATASADKKLKVWDWPRSRELCTLTGHVDSVIACSFTPDGEYIVSASADKTLRIWNADNGNAVCTIYLPGSIYSLGVHPCQLELICTDISGAIYRLKLMGITLGPLVVSAREVNGRYEIRCPACQSVSLIDESMLGKGMICPQTGCGNPLRINPFVIQPYFKEQNGR